MGYLHPEFPQDQLGVGKYTRWAENLSKSSLMQLLQLFGRSQQPLANLKPPCMSSPGKAREEKVSYFILYLGEICRTNVSSASLGNGFQDEFSLVQPAFSDKFRDELRANVDTMWATNLTQRSFAMLLWMVDGFKCRFDESRLPGLMDELAIRDKLEAGSVRNLLIELGSFGQL
ncbi:hypothetical protein BASA81_000792 [Batrachochytrium salamandrivorans]|nr:hypothetical protein BASA81_000792 [Batrachochytrium salamandrivorans]